MAIGIQDQVMLTTLASKIHDKCDRCDQISHPPLIFHYIHLELSYLNAKSYLKRKLVFHKADYSSSLSLPIDVLHYTMCFSPLQR